MYVIQPRATNTTALLGVDLKANSVETGASLLASHAWVDNLHSDNAVAHPNQSTEGRPEFTANKHGTFRIELDQAIK